MTMVTKLWMILKTQRNTHPPPGYWIKVSGLIFKFFRQCRINTFTKQIHFNNFKSSVMVKCCGKQPTYLVLLIGVIYMPATETSTLKSFSSYSAF